MEIWGIWVLSSRSNGRFRARLFQLSARKTTSLSTSFRPISSTKASLEPPRRARSRRPIRVKSDNISFSNCPSRLGSYNSSNTFNKQTRRLLSTQRDFLEQKGWLQEELETTHQEPLFYPKFHCELNFIERFWCSAKFYTRENCQYSLDGLREVLQPYS